MTDNTHLDKIARNLRLGGSTESNPMKPKRDPNGACPRATKRSLFPYRPPATPVARRKSHAARRGLRAQCIRHRPARRPISARRSKERLPQFFFGFGEPALMAQNFTGPEQGGNRLLRAIVGDLSVVLEGGLGVILTDGRLSGDQQGPTA